MKIKLKCDKNYGSDKGWIDADYIDTGLLNEIIKRFSKDNVVEVTEAIVDFYNVSRSSQANRGSHKTGNAITTQLRKYIRDCENAKIEAEERKIQLIKECLEVTCFLESIEPSEEQKIIRLLKDLHSKNIEQLEAYYNVNNDLRNFRLKRLMELV